MSSSKNSVHVLLFVDKNIVPWPQSLLTTLPALPKAVCPALAVYTSYSGELPSGRITIAYSFPAFTATGEANATLVTVS